MERVKRAEDMGEQLPEEDYVEQIHTQGIERIFELHANFFDTLLEFKTKLQNQVS